MNQRLHQQQAQQLGSETQVQSKTRSFEEAEEVIRADREQTPLPGSLDQKVAGSVSTTPTSSGKSWWRRLLGS